MNVFKTHSMEGQNRQEVIMYQNRIKSFLQCFLTLFSDLKYFFPMQNYIVFFCFFWRGIPCTLKLFCYLFIFTGIYYALNSVMAAVAALSSVFVLHLRSQWKERFPPPWWLKAVSSKQQHVSMSECKQGRNQTTI